jgi:hypothetical protein
VYTRVNQYLRIIHLYTYIFSVVRTADGKNFQLSTICNRGFGTKIMFFTYGFTTFIGKKFIDSCSLGLRQMAAKLYRSAERNKAYKAIPSLLLPRQTRRCSTPNRSPLPPAPSFGQTAKKKNTTFRKVNKIGGFFVFFPPILDPCCPISVPGDNRQMCKFREQFEE